MSFFKLKSYSLSRLSFIYNYFSCHKIMFSAACRFSLRTSRCFLRMTSTLLKTISSMLALTDSLGKIRIPSLCSSPNKLTSSPVVSHTIFISLFIVYCRFRHLSDVSLFLCSSSSTFSAIVLHSCFSCSSSTSKLWHD